jgi:DHA1 family multidrug resistance protein-like MFS transporter
MKSYVLPSDPENPSVESTFPPLKHTTSSRQAAQQLDDFDESPSNPRNWPNGKKWRISLTVALTGFISTCGSSIAVPGIHAVMDEFGVTNEKIGILLTTFYVLGLGWVYLFTELNEQMWAVPVCADLGTVG